ncbi:hypothetical protein AHF37_05159 [Paragonimus kellicotti]|nr:hypothetical protein AHF37_05159 [Paragonimus kellicotti]
MVDGLPPDNFYRVLLFAVSGELRGFPASMPSSPRVPSLPPLTAPNEIRCTTRGNQEIRVDWKPPDGIDCTGELINYVISVNSSRLIEPLLIKVDRDMSSYVIKGPGTIYYIRVIAVTRLGDGPAAYTVTMTKNLKMATPKPLSKGLIIPVNLVVRAVGASWARVGWELPEMPISYRLPSLAFQIKYYPIHLDQPRADVTLGPADEGTTGTNVVTIMNVTVPWTAHLSKQSKLFKAMLRGLKPATQYEFGVCMIQDELKDRGRHNRLADSREPTELCWSMVQGFETVGQNPADPPRNIRVTFPKGADSGKSTQASAEVLTVRLSWDPPTQPYGTIIAYLIYFTVDKHKMLNEWLERSVLGEVRQTDLPEMRSSEIYFLRMAARNRHGASPFSPVIVFRTPDGRFTQTFAEEFYNFWLSQGWTCFHQNLYN